MAAPATADPVRYLDEVFVAFDQTNGIPYGENLDEPGEELLLDLFEPRGDTETERPVVIWAHGGGFTSGTRTSENIRQLARAFARRGYVTASISYRLSDAEGVTAIQRAVEDLRAAVRWFRANASTLDIDPNRISVGGYSAGAVMALTAALRGGATPGSHQGWSSAVASAVSFSGAGLTDGVASDPPVVMFHGRSDTRVPYAGLWSGTRTCEVTRYFGSDCIFRTFDGVAHGIFDDGDRDALMITETAQFLSCRVGAETAFTDLTDWVDLAVGWASRAEIVRGFADATFRPGAPLTRGQLVAMLWALLDRPPGPGGDAPFSDTPAWLATPLAWAADAGIATGYADGTFRAGEPVTRAQAARLLHRAAGEADVSELPAPELSDVPPWVTEAVRWLVAPRAVQLLGGGGIATGYADDTFRPALPVTRGQVVRWLHGLALAGEAWGSALQADPVDAACYRLGDPVALDG